jgi:hypothetical protein
MNPFTETVERVFQSKLDEFVNTIACDPAPESTIQAPDYFNQDEFVTLFNLCVRGWHCTAMPGKGLTFTKTEFGKDNTPGAPCSDRHARLLTAVRNALELRHTNWLNNNLSSQMNNIKECLKLHGSVSVKASECSSIIQSLLEEAGARVAHSPPDNITISIPLV